MASNGGCGGCGGADRRDRDEVVLQQGQGREAQRMEEDEYTAMSVNALDDEEAAELLRQMPTHNLDFGEDGELHSADGESDESEAEEDEGEAAGRPSNSEGKGEKKQPRASINIVRSAAYGVETLAMQQAMREFVQPGLSAAQEQMVVAIAAAMIMASEAVYDGEERLDRRTVVEAVQANLITEQQLMTHCADRGVPADAQLNQLAVKSLKSLATVLTALQKLGKVTGHDKLEGDAFGMYYTYKIVDRTFWEQLLERMCAVGRMKSSTLCLNVFQSMSGLYETLNMLGYGPDRRNHKNAEKGKGTWQNLKTWAAKKLNAMLHRELSVDYFKRDNNTERLWSKRESTGKNEGKGRQPGEYNKRPAAGVSENVRRWRAEAEERKQRAEDAKPVMDVKMTEQKRSRKRACTQAQNERQVEVRLAREKLAKNEGPSAAFADELGNVVQTQLVTHAKRGKRVAHVVTQADVSSLQAETKRERRVKLVATAMRPVTQADEAAVSSRKAGTKRPAPGEETQVVKKRVKLVAKLVVRPMPSSSSYADVPVGGKNGVPLPPPGPSSSYADVPVGGKNGVPLPPPEPPQ